MSRRSVDAVFSALFLLTDIRFLLRETAPSHALDPAQKEEAARVIEKLKRQVAILEEELVQ